MRAAVTEAADPVAAPVLALVRAYAPLDDPATAANNLAQLAFDLADAELRALMAGFYAVMEAELAPLLDRAITRGRLPGAPPVPVAARILTALADGTAVHWSARPVDGLCDRMRADLDAVLAGWCREPAGAPGVAPDEDAGRPDHRTNSDAEHRAGGADHRTSGEAGEQEGYR
jgi:AcrR family transcriptional regulator